MEIRIYSKEGGLRLEVEAGSNSTQTEEIQGGSVLSLSFTLPEAVVLDVNDHADFMGRRYWVTERYRPVQRSTVEWVYTVRLYGLENLISRFLVLNTTDGDAEPVFSLTAAPREHVALIVRAINEGFGTTDWKVGAVEGVNTITVDYHGKYCDEGLKAVAEKAGTEYWIEGTTVNVSRCEHGERIAMGYENGLTKVQPDVADNNKVYTRLFPVGSTRNIDPARYGASRLRLPDGARYVDVNTEKYGVIHHYEESAFAGIYPRRTGTVSEVRSEERMGDDGTAYRVYYFKDAELNFDPNDYDIPGLVKRVSFQEGSELAGLGHEDKGSYYLEADFDSKTGEFEIVTLFKDDIQIPGGVLAPKVGDRYILWNLRMPDEYYVLAEAELLDAVNEYNRAHAVDVACYKAQTDYLWVEKLGVALHAGQRVRLESREYFPETGYKDTRITRIVRRVDNPAQMDVEMSDALSTGAMEKIQGSIDEVRAYVSASRGSLPDIIRTTDKTLPTDNNLFSARRSQKEFISKNSPDRARRKIIFDEGIDAGDFIAGVQGGTIDGKGNAELLSIVVRLLLSSPKFVDGLNGEGWRIWLENELSHLTVDRLTVRQVMTVFELLIEKIRSVGGQICVSAANGKIKEVKTDGDSYVITFEQGNSFMAGDLMRCATFKGGTTEGYWVEIAGADPDSVRVRADEFAGAEPKPGDECVLMGSATDAGRRSFILISATEDGQPRMDVMDGVAGKSLAGCLRARVGNLDGITDNGFPADNQPHGHGLYSDNAYLRGTFLLSTGEDIKTKFEIVEGKITSAVDGVRRDIFMEKGYLGNSNFAVGMEKWETSGGILHYTFGSTWLWVGNGILATRKPGVEVARDGDRMALRIENDYILQRNADMRNRPEPMVNAGGEKLAVPVFLSVFYRCVKAGRLTVRFENVDKTGFENFNSMEAECDLDASEEYNQLTMEGLWNGSGDFLLKFSGEIYICMIVLSTDKAEALTYRHRTLFEQSEKIVKIAAQNFDRDGNVLEESGILTTARMAGLYAIDGDGRLKSFVGAGQDGVKIKSDSIELEGLVTANSNFRILEDGSVEANKGTFNNVVINGSIRSPFVRETDAIDIPGDWEIVGRSEGGTETRTKATHDNVVPIGVASGWVTAGYLEWDPGQSGRRMVIANYRWENEITTGWVKYTAPKGMYFFEDGVGKEALTVSRECVELIGYGTDTTFYGWIVLRRIDLMTQGCYGRALKSLATGRVSGRSRGATIQYRTFDDSSLSVERIREGRYRVTIPPEWKLRSDRYMVLLTGYGVIEGGANPIKATLADTTAGYFDVVTSDDETVNDGSFMFAVTNLDDWV